MQTRSLHIEKLLPWLEQQLLIQKLNNPLGYVLLLGLALFVAGVFTFLGLKVGILMVGLIVGVPVLLLCFVNLEFGLFFTVSFALFVEFMKKFTGFPVGTILDGLLLILFSSLILRAFRERSLKFASHPISFFILLWIYYNLMQAFNPIAASRIAWIYAVRSLATWTLLYFVACYVFNAVKSIKRAWVLVIGLSLLGALYGFKQEFLGFSSWEMAWLYADPLRFRLIFTWSRLRVFSLYSDPTSFGILMATVGMFCMVLATYKFDWWKRIALVLATLLMFLSMTYAGSRTPFVMIPAGVLFFTIMTFRKEVIIGTAIMLVLGTAFLMKSTSNPVIFRIQSAFNPDDSSMQLRLKNQEMIQPFIQSHPFGAGLGSVGLWGQRFSPNTWLAGFAPDSGFVRIAVEGGWVGLIINMSILMAAMFYAVRYYFRVQNPKIKAIYLAIANFLFLLTLANYPQEAIAMLPINPIFNLALAAVVRLKDFDDN